MDDLQAFADVVAQAIDTATAPLLARIAVLEKRAIIHGRDGRDGLHGKDAQPIDVDQIVTKTLVLIPKPADGKNGERGERGQDGQPGAKGDPGRDGKDAAPVDVDAIAVKAALLVQPGRDGKDGKDADSDLIAGLQSELLLLKSWIGDQQARESAVGAKVASAVELAVKAMPAPQHGQDGRSVDVAEVKAMVAECVKDAVAALPVPKDGKDGEDAVVDVAEVARLAAALVPVPKNGKDAPAPDLDVIAMKAAALVPKPADGKDGDDGRDVDASMLETIVAAHVERAVFAMPKPSDGKSLTLDDVAPLIESEVAKAVMALPKAKDGRGVLYTSINQDGDLEVTFSDGGREKSGKVVGAPGKDADMDALRKHAEDLIERIPKPKDGEPGKDGLDGLGFDDMDLVIDDEKGFTFRWSKSDQVKERPIPLPFDRGVYRPGTSYRKSSMVTAQGSLWLALKDTTDKPGDSKAWRLIVKRGRDGRDAPPRDGDV